MAIPSHGNSTPSFVHLQSHHQPWLPHLWLHASSLPRFLHSHISLFYHSVECEGRLAHVARAFPIGINSFTSPPPTTTTPPPPSTKWEGFHVHTILPARNVDVWTVALRSFRDTIILPIATALNARLSVLNQELEGLPESHTYPRLQQLLLVLVSQGRQPTTASLTALAPSQGELAVPHQLKLMRSDAPSMRAAAQRWGSYAAGTHSFFSGNVPHNRRGRISHKPGLDEPGSDFEDDALTPRLTTTITAPRRAELQWWRRVAVTTIAEAVDGGLHGGDRKCITSTGGAVVAPLETLNEMGSYFAFVRATDGHDPLLSVLGLALSRRRRDGRTCLARFSSAARELHALRYVGNGKTFAARG